MFGLDIIARNPEGYSSIPKQPQGGFVLIVS